MNVPLQAPVYVDDEVRPTAMQVIYDACIEHGYVGSKAEFSRLTRIAEGNVYKYLTGTEKPHRLYANAGFLHALCWALTKQTTLSCAVLCWPDGQLQVIVGGVDVHGHPIESVTYDTSYHLPYQRQGDGEWEADFRPSRSWREEWEEEWSFGSRSEA